MEASCSSVGYIVHVVPLRSASHSVTAQKTAVCYSICNCIIISIQTNKYSLAEGYPYNLPCTCFGACVALSSVFTDLIMACTWAETCSSETVKVIFITVPTIVRYTSCVQSSVLYNGHIYCIWGHIHSTFYTSVFCSVYQELLQCTGIILEIILYFLLYTYW